MCVNIERKIIMEKHYCKLSESEISAEHVRELDIQSYGAAVYSCRETEDGVLIVENEEYASQVNFCPVCGFPARVKVLPE
jgi:galactose mutarotase-like enzyme